MMTRPAIEIENLAKSFVAGKREVMALDDLSARIEAGKITGLVGPDGAGKTTLMRLIAGLLKPDAGKVTVLGLDSVAQAQHLQERLGYMPQRFGLYEDLSVAENLELYADLHGLATAARTARFDMLMQFTGLAPFRKRLAGRLSGGMKQKLGLACSLVHPPELLLLDEPSVGVDPVSRRELWSIVQSLATDGMSVLWATAYFDEAERCDNVLMMNEGKLLAAGPPGSFSAEFEGRTFAIRGAVADRRTIMNEVSGLPYVVDAIIKGRDVRVVVAEKSDAPALAEFCRGLSVSSPEMRAVPPAFEDAFVSLIKPSEPGQKPRAAPAKTPPAPQVATSGEPVIRVAGLVRKFGDFTAVDHIDFTVKRGEIFGLLGPNGAGKSTTFKMLCGLLPPTDGQALVLGIDLRQAAAVARGRIGYMAQKFSLYGNMSVQQNLSFFASAYGLTGKTRNRKIDEEMDEFDLRRFSDAVSEDLPLGYKQRLALACAIMHQPGVLFLDEPTSGVDPLVRREFWTRINAMAAAGVTVLVTTHFMEEAEYCDRIGIVYRGRFIATGTPEELKDEHKTAENPDPSLQDAFIDLVERYESQHPQ